MFRQRLLSTDVLPHDSTDTSSASPILPHHPRYRHNVAHVSIQTLETMNISTSNLFDSTKQKEEQQEWLPIPFPENPSRLCQLRLATIQTTVQQLFLPVFPVCNNNNEFYPLLANTPIKELSTVEQRVRRAHHFEEKYASLLLQFDVKLRSDLQQWLDFYGRQWNVHQTVLTINLNRLYHLLSRFTLHDYFIKVQQKSYQLSMEEWFLVLEYYLQMDASCFYMKTCNFYNAKPQWDYIGIFPYGTPRAHYGMKQCKDKSCRFCYERLDLTNRFERAMHFSNKQVHCFLNQYRVYLNCDVTCTTSNVIYALTCPCHRYDYIGRCHVAFRERMRKHRTYGCRLISNFFIGKINANRLQDDRESDPLISDCQRKLYEHSTQCSVPLQLFLQCHPEYWCFVPMTHEQARIDNVNLTSAQRQLLVNYQDSLFIEREINRYERTMPLVRWCVNHVPLPPSNYQFSLLQILEQYEFFHKKSEVSVTRFLDLYNAAIVIALPENASDALRHTVEALLVMYAEPKLVITTSDVDQELKSDDSTIEGYWCENLLHPRLLAKQTSKNT
ncbi:unnamed protein product [Rotaria sordida]|uniref:Uncharacterized protein n=1 Tax=Rotaria sordida TaxID=392033 RepID=A0A818X403_9BILA|nr:unnamed protein product [Rotaria sordida]